MEFERALAIEEDRERGGQKTERLRVMDWEHPANNDFLLTAKPASLAHGGGKARRMNEE